MRLKNSMISSELFEKQLRKNVKIQKYVAFKTMASDTLIKFCNDNGIPCEKEEEWSNDQYWVLYTIIVRPEDAMLIKLHFSDTNVILKQEDYVRIENR